MNARVRHFLSQLTATALLFALPYSSRAAIFNPHSIISDAEMRDSSAMSAVDIARFLKSHGHLATVTDRDPVDGKRKDAAHLIADTSARYAINPKYLLALIEKESSAVTTKRTTRKQLDWATGYSLCDQCSRTSPLARKFQGFARQIDAGASWMNWFLSDPNAANLPSQPGKTLTLNGTTIIPTNRATAALYNYTPHVHGNQLLWSIWRQWFGGLTDLQLPDGSLVRNVATGAIAVIEGGEFRFVTSPSVLASRFESSNIIDMEPKDFETLAASKLGRPLKYADLSVVRTERGNIYLLVGEKKRHIVDETAFMAIGFNPEEIESATEADMADYADGAPLTALDADVSEHVVRETENGALFLVGDGEKRAIVDATLLDADYKGSDIQQMSAAQLDGYRTGDAVKLRDGELAKSPSSPAVYVIAAGAKRLIPTADVFTRLGYEWKNVKVVSDAVLALHPDGAPLVSQPQAKPGERLITF